MGSIADTGQLRVAILSDSETQRTNLRSVLEQCGLQVVENETLTAGSILSITKRDADVLLVDLDDEADHELDFLDGLMESPLPILFNDSAATRMHVAHTRSDWGRNLARKLAEIANKGRKEIQSVDESLEEDQELVASEEPEIIAGEEPRAEFSVGVSVDEAIPADASRPAERLEQPALEDSPVVEMLSPPPELAEQPGKEVQISADQAPKHVCVLGASIGGPQAVKNFLAALNRDAPVAFVLAQHIGASFIELLAKQLSRSTGFKVKPAKSGRLLRQKQIVIAPVGHRLLIGPDGRIALESLQTYSVYSPSIDAVMTDIAIRYGANAGAVMFSGMGNDGVRGCQVIASRGGFVWAQEPQSCVISSMPDSARRAGVVSYSGNPEQLAKRLIEHFSD